MKDNAPIKIPATYMRGGTSKGVFFKLDDLPIDAQLPGQRRDQLLLRIMGSPDPYGQQIDGMGGASSSTSKVVILSKSEDRNHDVDYLFGQVSIDKPLIDWSGNCGNLTAAAGAFAITKGLVDPVCIPQNGISTVRIWQKNIGKTIIAHIPVNDGAVQEHGNFILDGVAFPSAEIKLEFMDPVDRASSLFPTGNIVDELRVPKALTSNGKLKATLINSGIPTIFVQAADIGYKGTELQDTINNDPAALQGFEQLRAYGAMKMGLIKNLSEANTRQHTPKIVFVSPPQDYLSSSGKTVLAQDIDLCARALSMGKLHHAMMGTAAVAIATATAIPGTQVNMAAGGGKRESVTFGHPSGLLSVGAEVDQIDGQWTVKKVAMSRSARVLMEGVAQVVVNDTTFL